MEVKYAVRQVSVDGHNAPAYLQESEYGLQFTFRASQPRDIYYFDSKDEALKYMKENFKYVYFEIVEVYSL